MIQPLAIAIDIGGTNTVFGLVDVQGSFTPQLIIKISI